MYTVSGNVHFSGKVKGERSDIEPEIKDMMSDLALYAQEKYPQFVWDAGPVSLWTKVSKLVKANGARRSSD